MAYSISYDHIPLPAKQKNKPKGKTVLLGACVVVIAVLIALVPGVSAAVQQFLFPGSDGTAVKALEDMATGIGEGEPVGEAVHAFCQDVFEAAAD